MSSNAGRLLAALGMATMTCACSSASSTASGTTSSSTGGGQPAALAVADTRATIAGPLLDLSLTSWPAACDHYQQGADVQGGKSFDVLLTQHDATAMAAAGTFQIGTNAGADLSMAYTVRDATCTATTTPARSGTLTLTSVLSKVEGSFSFVLEDGSTAAATFSAPECSPLPTIPATTCKP